MTKALKKIALFGVPFDGNSSFTPGPAKAPKVIRNTLANGSLNSTAENQQDLKNNPHLIDVGDLTLQPEHDFVKTITSQLDGYLQQGLRILTLGGDHSITYPILRAYAKHFPKINLLHIDAHPDLYDSFKGNRLANACPFARIMEEDLSRRLVQVGIRTLNKHQLQQAHKFNVEIITMQSWQPDLLPSFDGPVYLSLDIDAIDPAFAPGVSHREPGGLTSREVINIIHQINAPIIGGDIVEFNPDKDIEGMTAQLTAKLTKELAGRMLADRTKN